MNPSLRRRMVSALFYLIFAATFGLVLFRNRQSVQLLSLDTLVLFCLALGLTGVNIFLKGLLNLVLFGRHLDLDLVHCIRLGVLNTVGNYLPFSGGTVYKGILLKRNTGLSYSRYLGITGYMFLATVGASGLAGLACSLHLGHPTLIWPFFLMALPLLAPYLPLPGHGEAWAQGKSRPLASLFRLLAGLRESRRLYRPCHPAVLTLSLTLLVIVSLRMGLVFRVTGLELGLVELVFVNCANFVTRLVSVAPGGIGVREGLVALLGHFLGLDLELTILAVGLDRVADALAHFWALLLLGGSWNGPFRTHT